MGCANLRRIWLSKDCFFFCASAFAGRIFSVATIAVELDEQRIIHRAIQPSSLDRDCAERSPMYHAGISLVVGSSHWICSTCRSSRAEAAKSSHASPSSRVNLSTVFFARPVIRLVARKLLPSTRKLISEKFGTAGRGPVEAKANTLTCQNSQELFRARHFYSFQFFGGGLDIGQQFSPCLYVRGCVVFVADRDCHLHRCFWMPQRVLYARHLNDDFARFTPHHITIPIPGERSHASVIRIDIGYRTIIIGQGPPRIVGAGIFLSPPTSRPTSGECRADVPRGPICRLRGRNNGSFDRPSIHYIIYSDENIFHIFFHFRGDLLGRAHCALTIPPFGYLGNILVHFYFVFNQRLMNSENQSSPLPCFWHNAIQSHTAIHFKSFSVS